jgi:hypothetical protein
MVQQDQKRETRDGLPGGRDEVLVSAWRRHVLAGKYTRDAQDGLALRCLAGRDGGAMF